MYDWSYEHAIIATHLSKFYNALLIVWSIGLILVLKLISLNLVRAFEIIFKPPNEPKLRKVFVYLYPKCFFYKT